jgi:carbonic anhydrase
MKLVQLLPWGLVWASFQYDYAHHGADWHGACEGPLPQSPIDFLPTHSRIPPAGKLAYNYREVTSPFELANNGHALFADLGGRELGGVSYDDVWYNLLNVAFKAPAEHTFDGLRLGGELHLLHQKWDSPDLLVVAVPLRAPAPLDDSVGSTFLQVGGPARGGAGRSEEEGFNRMFEIFMRTALPRVHASVPVVATSVDTLDVNQWMEGTFFEYQGTTTVPPCAKAAWFVKREPLVVSRSQMGNISQAIYETTAGYGNYREPQPLNDRMIRVREGVRQRPIPGFPPTFSPPDAAGPPDVAGSRVYKALRTEKDALTIAKLTGEYVDDLDRRVTEAAAAHAAILEGPLPGMAAPTAAPVDVPQSKADIQSIVREALHGAVAEAKFLAPDAVAQEAPP